MIFSTQHQYRHQTNLRTIMSLDTHITTVTYWFILTIINIILQNSPFYYCMMFTLQGRSPLLDNYGYVRVLCHWFIASAFPLQATYIIVYVTTHPYCAGCTVGLLLYTDRLVITLQTNWVRYSHTNHRKHYFNKRKEKEGITTFMKRQNRA